MLSVWRDAGRADAAQPNWGSPGEALDVDVENLLAKAADNLSVRRSFGTAYETDGMLIGRCARITDRRGNHD